MVLRASPNSPINHFPIMPSSKQNNHIIIGRLGKPHGIKGWMKLHSFSHPTEQILNYQPWLVQEKKTWQTISIEDIKQNHDQILIKIKNCNTPEAAKHYTNQNIATHRDNLPVPQEDEYYWTDLEGLNVIDQQGQPLGVVDHLFNTGANDIMSVKLNGVETLIPFLKEVIIDVNFENKTIQVDWEELSDEDH